MNIPAVKDTPAYIVIRSKRKSLGLYIRNNALEVRAPSFLANNEIHQFVHSKRHWIKQRLQEQQLQDQERPQIKHGANLLFMGQEREIIVAPGPNYVAEKPDKIIINSTNLNDVNKHQLLLENWLKNEARQYINERCLELAKLMAVHNRITTIKYRKTKSKWGHCTSTGILQFNWLIIMAPVEVIDYLLIHELSHLSFMDHSLKFWQRVEDFSPDYKKHRKWLNNEGHKICL